MIQRFPRFICSAGTALLLSLGGCASSQSPQQQQPLPPQPSWRFQTPPLVQKAVPDDAERPSGVKPAGPPPVEYFGAPGKASSDARRDVDQNAKANTSNVELNFVDADVRNVTASVLGDMLKLDYFIDPSVQGKITLRTGKPISTDSVLPALEAALQTVSVALIVDQAGVKVVPMDSAPQHVHQAQKFDAAEARQPGFAVEIIPVRYVSVKEMQKILESFAPKGSILQADEVHDHFVIAGTSQDRAAIAKTIEGFDTDGMQGMSFALYKIEQSTPEQVVSDLKQIFQPPLELVTQRIRLISISRLQSILGISKYHADLETLEPWIRKLDKASKTSDRRLYVYNVQNGSAKDLAKSIQLVMTGTSLGDQQGGAGMLTQPGMPASQGLQNSLAPATGTQVVNAPSDKVANYLASPSANSAGTNQSRVVANEENNSLLIFATDQEFKVMKDSLRQLDVMPRQVMIEAMIAEVTLEGDLSYGVQWYLNSGKGAMTLSNSSSNAIGAQFPGFSYMYSGSVNAQVVLSALQSETSVKILSAPKLSVLNNQKAELLVGDQVPVLTQTSQATASPGAPVISTVQMVDTGISLEITPRISENGNVILDVTQEVSSVATTTSSGIDSPTIQKRRLHSVVATHDNSTVALGGLISEERNSGNSGVPVLKNIPVVGNLFKTANSSATRTELIVLLVPHVMRDATETQAVAESLINNMSSSAEFLGNANASKIAK